MLLIPKPYIDKHYSWKWGKKIAKFNPLEERVEKSISLAKK